MNYNLKIDLTKLYGAKIVSDPDAGEGIFIPAGGPVEISDGRGALSLTQKALQSIPYVGHMRPWDKSAQTPGPGCKTCRWAQEARYASGVNFLRCNHPNADWNSTRDTRHISACPDKNNQNK